MSYLTTVRVPAEYQDADGRLRVSNPVTIHDATFYNDRRLQEWSERTNGGSITFSSPAVSLQAPANTNKVVRQSRMYIPYTPGKTQTALISGILDTSGGSANGSSRIGMFDDVNDQTVNALPGNGFFFQLSGVSSSSTLSVVQRTGISGTQTDTVVTQANWNIDKLDGTGKSGITLNVTLRQTFYIELNWLGAGTVVMGLLVNRAFVPCHQFNYGNSATPAGSSAFISTGSLPIRYEVNGTGVNSIVMKQISSTVISEGGALLNTPRTRSMSATGNLRSITGGKNPLVSIRLKSTRNRCTVIPVSIQAAMSTTGTVLISLYRFISPLSFNATGPLSSSGPTWVPASSNSVTGYTDNSCIEFDFSSQIIDLSGNTYPWLLIRAFAVSGASGGPISASIDLNDPSLSLTSDITGNSDWFILTGEIVNGGVNESLLGSINWVEQS